ncbi:putative leucine-rich repeat-containing protein DDB_G0290503 [Sphaeramia orbicularis]|uniref:putative leucine-rich repeat-containing protein DDB_G0290503 n=1 Tax=Sphaeramia orbicularis TaxID=375764 RepID=UPI00117C8B4F|nr:putative leucine-rich repeat-containing protein DDB_G0290503 [Sphaeramia orbicularis]
MSSVLFLLLLVCSSMARIQSLDQGSDLQDQLRSGLDHVDVPPDLSALWDELRGLKVLVLSLKAVEVDQRQVLRSVETRLRDGQEELKDLNRTLRARVEVLEQLSAVRGSELWAQVSDVRSRLNATEVSAADLKQKNTVLAAELPFLQTRLRASESTVEELRRRNTVLSVRMCNTESLLEDLRRRSSEFPASNVSSGPDRNVPLEYRSTKAEGDVTEVQLRLNSTQHHLDQLRTHTADRLTSAEKRLEELTAVTAALMDRLTDAEHQLDQLRTESTDCGSSLWALTLRLNSTHEQVTQLKQHITDAHTELGSVSDKLTVFQTNAEALQVRLLAGEDELRRRTEVHLSDIQSRLESADRTSTGFHVRLVEAEQLIQDLQNHGSVHSTVLSTLRKQTQDCGSSLWALTLRLNSTHEQVTQLTQHITDAHTELGSVSDKLTVFQTNAEGFLLRLQVHENHLSELKTQTSALTKRQNQTEEYLQEVDRTMTERLNRTEELLREVDRTMTEEHLQEVDRTMTERLNRTEERLQEVDRTMTERLNRTEERLQEVDRTMTERLNRTEERLQEVDRTVTERLNWTEERLQEVDRTTDQENVAFSAGLTDSGSVGPFDDETTLIFSKTITNVGGAYDRTTGVFTAPLTGLYFFCFTAADYLKGYMGVQLLVNERPVLFSLDLNAHGGYASTSNGLVVNLDRRDRVRLSLPASYRLYDDSRNFSVFSGFLLFPL